MDYNNTIHHNTTDKDISPKIGEAKVSEAGNESLIAVLTACIGCFIGIVMTSFIFLCCNPCNKLTMKQKQYFSSMVSLRKISTIYISCFSVVVLNYKTCTLLLIWWMSTHL